MPPSPPLSHKITLIPGTADSVCASIELADVWTISESSPEKRYTPSMFLGSKKPLPSYPAGGYTALDLIKVDADLPALFAAMKTNKTVLHWTMPGQQLRVTLALRCGTLLTMSQDMIEHCPTDCHISPAGLQLSATTEADGQAVLHLLFTRYQTARLPDSTLYIEDVGPDTARMSTAWLDTKQPDWRIRLLLAQSLGYDAFEMAETLLFGSNDVAPWALPDQFSADTETRPDGQA